MTRECRKRLFDILDQIEDLAEPLELQKVMEPGTVQESKGNQEPEPKKEPEPKPELPEGWTGPNHDTKKRYSPEFKKMIVRLHKEEKQRFEDITNQYGVSKATVTKWCNDVRYENMAKVSDKEKELQIIREENAKIKNENAFLKKVLVMFFKKETEELA